MSGELPFDEECFFIGPIGDDGSDIRKRSDAVYQFIVGRAAQELGLTAVRADKISSPGQINLQVIEHVLSAKVAVADLRGLNANVFYEVAIRHTAKLPMVLIAERGTRLPFDISQMRTIFFDHTDLADADECRNGIVTQLSDVLRTGEVDSPIGTARDVASLSGGSAVERTVAELVTTVEEVSRMQRDTYRFLRDSRTPRLPLGLVDDLQSGLEQLEQFVSADPESDIAEVVADLGRPIDYIKRRYGAEPRRSAKRQSALGREISERQELLRLRVEEDKISNKEELEALADDLGK